MFMTSGLELTLVPQPKFSILIVLQIRVASTSDNKQQSV